MSSNCSIEASLNNQTVNPIAECDQCNPWFIAASYVRINKQWTQLQNAINAIHDSLQPLMWLVMAMPTVRLTASCNCCILPLQYFASLRYIDELALNRDLLWEKLSMSSSFITKTFHFEHWEPQKYFYSPRLGNSKMVMNGENEDICHKKGRNKFHHKNVHERR